ncbi:MAG TPA: hypothetical protein VI357_15680 [Mycobacteriales bacterium]
MGETPEQVQAAIQAHMQALPLPDWPVFDAGDEDAGWLAGARDDGRGSVDCVRLDHRPPGAAQRLIVQTEPDPGPPVSLAYVLSQLSGPDDGEPLALATAAPDGTAAEALVDDRPAAALTRSDGAATVWTVQVQGVLVIAAARAVPLGRLRLTRVPDLLPYQRRRAAEIDRYLAQHPQP